MFHRTEWFELVAQLVSVVAAFFAGHGVGRNSDRR